MKDLFAEQTAELAHVVSNLGSFHGQVEKVARLLHETFEHGGTVYVAGNGGSAAEAQHFSDEMVGRYKGDRTAYPVIALTADSAVVTCIGNDFGFDSVFQRQIEALGKQGDVFIGLTTSGTSKNILLAAEAARDRGMTVVAFTGERGSFKDTADCALVVPTQVGARMQELHLHAIHLICETFEE